MSTIFESAVSLSSSYNGFPDWISEVWQLPEAGFEFDMSSIRPSEVKRVLKGCSFTSAPGDDGISYFHLKKLPSFHNF